MSINMLKRSKVQNSTDNVGVDQKVLTREDLQRIAGYKTGAITVPSLNYISFECDLASPFYCNLFSMSIIDGYALSYCYYKTERDLSWKTMEVTKTSDQVLVDFNQVKPDHAQLITVFKFTFVNLHTSDILLSEPVLSSVDYPIGFDYVHFDIAASSHSNSPISITNNCVQGTAKDVKVLPIFSNDWDLDQVYVLTHSGSNMYHINTGYRIPEQAGWDHGVITTSGGLGTLEIANQKLTLSGTAVSGTWISPVLYLPDDDYITMYVYHEDVGDDAYLERDFQKVQNLVEVRASDGSPLPNFLVTNWTKRFFTFSGRRYQEEQVLPERRATSFPFQDSPEAQDSVWYIPKRPRPCGDMGYVSPKPWICGRSKRMYMKGDGEIIAEAPREDDDSTQWEFANRGYTYGLPIKEFGDINDYFNAGQFINLLGSFIPHVTSACGMGVSPAKFHHFTFASENDSTYWALGKDIKTKLINTAPYAYFQTTRYNLGVAQEPIFYEFIGSTTMAVSGHPNEWVIIATILFPFRKSSQKYAVVFYMHIRNFWVSSCKFLGAYGIGFTPVEEGHAVCKSTDGGFWLHIGYSKRILNRYDLDGELVSENRVNYSYNSIVETQEPNGLWALRNNAIYWYSVDSNYGLTEEFVVYTNDFAFLQLGGIDSAGNLWVVDRDTSTVYRINLSSRSIDYQASIPYVVAVWPHPNDGSAYIYRSFNYDTFSTDISRIWVDDVYQYVELISELPELPISDYSGVQFMGKTIKSFITPATDDPIWGFNDAATLEWADYPNGSLTIPKGKYKQIRITLQKEYGADSPKIHKIRLPKSLLMSQVPYGDSEQVYLNPHLRYNKKYGHFSTELVAWWDH